MNGFRIKIGYAGRYISDDLVFGFFWDNFGGEKVFGLCFGRYGIFWANFD